jgi:hypothetical protein
MTVHPGRMLMVRLRNGDEAPFPFGNRKRTVMEELRAAGCQGREDPLDRGVWYFSPPAATGDDGESRTEPC